MEYRDTYSGPSSHSGSNAQDPYAAANTEAGGGCSNMTTNDACLDGGVLHSGGGGGEGEGQTLYRNLDIHFPDGLSGANFPHNNNSTFPQHEGGGQGGGFASSNLVDVKSNSSHVMEQAVLSSTPCNDNSVNNCTKERYFTHNSGASAANNMLPLNPVESNSNNNINSIAQMQNCISTERNNEGSAALSSLLTATTPLPDRIANDCQIYNTNNSNMSSPTTAISITSNNNSNSQVVNTQSCSTNLLLSCPSNNVHASQQQQQQQYDNISPPLSSANNVCNQASNISPVNTAQSKPSLGRNKRKTFNKGGHDTSVKRARGGRWGRGRKANANGRGGLPTSSLEGVNYIPLPQDKKKKVRHSAGHTGGGNGTGVYETANEETKKLFCQVRDVIIYEIQHFKVANKKVKPRKKGRKNNSEEQSAEQNVSQEEKEKELVEEKEKELVEKHQPEEVNLLNTKQENELFDKDIENVVMEDEEVKTPQNSVLHAEQNKQINSQDTAANANRSDEVIDAVPEEEKTNEQIDKNTQNAKYKMSLALIGQLLSVQMSLKKVTFRRRKLMYVIDAFPDVFTKQGAGENKQIDIILNDNYANATLDNIPLDVKQYMGVLLKANSGISEGDMSNVVMNDCNTDTTNYKQDEKKHDVATAAAELKEKENIANSTEEQGDVKDNQKKRKKKNKEKNVNNSKVVSATDAPLFAKAKDEIVEILKTYKEKNYSATLSELGQLETVKNIMQGLPASKRRLVVLFKQYPESFKLLKLEQKNKFACTYTQEGVQLLLGNVVTDDSTKIAADFDSRNNAGNNEISESCDPIPPSSPP